MKRKFGDGIKRMNVGEMKFLLYAKHSTFQRGQRSYFRALRIICEARVDYGRHQS
jgi:hypothetical protein